MIIIQSTDNSDQDESFRKRVFSFLGVMTIEPIVLFSNLARGIAQISIDQMNVYKICRGLIFTGKVWHFCYFYHLEEKFNLTVEFCANIENNTEAPVYTAVEKEVEYNNKS